MTGKLLPLRRIEGLPSEMSDEALIAACATGDTAALGALYDRLQPALWRFLARLVGADADEIDDLVHGTFMAVNDSAARFRGGSSVRTWVFAIASNLARHHVRSEVRRRGAMGRLLDAPPARRAERPDESAEHRQLLVRLREGLDQLPHDLRMAFVLCDLESFPGAEAAGVLGVPEGTLGRRLHEARRRLRSFINGEDGSPPRRGGAGARGTVP